MVTVTAVPNPGYAFTGWSGDLAGAANPTTITLNANKSITANTILPPLPRTGWVASASSANGSPANAIDGNIGTRWSTGVSQANGQWFQVDMGSVRTFNRIVMDAGSSTGDYPRGYQVYVSNDGSNWGSLVATGVGSSAVTTVTFAMQTARYIRVNQTGSVSGIWWSIHEFNVYVFVTGYTLATSATNGSIEMNPPGGVYTNGTVVTLTATPSNGYTFASWSGDLTGSTNPATITMTGNKSVQANSIATYTLTGVTYGPGGSLSFSVTNAGGVYRVQTHTNLANPAGWVTISTNTAPFTFTDTSFMGVYPQRFYRLVTA